jgi:hypothetical protein
MCNDCLARRRVKADLSSPGTPAPAAARAIPAPEVVIAGDPGHTMIGADAPESAFSEPAREPRRAAERSEEGPIPMPTPSPTPPPAVPAARLVVEPRPSTPAAAAANHTAVVWIDPGRPRPTDLFEALTGRGIKAIEVSNSFMAIAEVCRLSRSRGTSNGTPDNDGLLALVAVSPEAQPETAAVCEAVGRYAKGTPCWMFGPARAPRLRPILEGDLAEWRGGGDEHHLPPRVPTLTVARPMSRPEGTAASVPAKSETPRSPAALISGPHLRLAGTDDRSDEAKLIARNADSGQEGAVTGTESARGRGGSNGSEDNGRPPLLSAEELAMLLGDEDADR